MDESLMERRRVIDETLRGVKIFYRGRRLPQSEFSKSDFFLEVEVGLLVLENSFCGGLTVPEE